MSILYFKMKRWHLRGRQINFNHTINANLFNII